VKTATCCLALTVALTVATHLPAGAVTLGDVLREHGWANVIGTWVDADTGGEVVKITYAWRFPETVIEITSRSQERETVALMGLNAKTGEVGQFGANSRGGVHMAKWDVVEGDAVIGLAVVTEKGKEVNLEIRHHRVDEDTMVLSIGGPKPTTIRMVRVEPAKEPAQELARAPAQELQLQDAGIDPRMMGLIKAALSKRAGVKDEQMAEALAGIVKTVLGVQAQGEGFEMGAGLRTHLKEEVGLTDEQVGMVTGIARRLEWGKREAKRKKEGTFTEGDTVVYVETSVRNLDADGNLTVEEGELEKGFLGMLGQYEECHGVLLTLFDKNKDGAIGKDEGKAVRELVFSALEMMLYDQNRDGKVDDTEADQAWDSVAEQIERHNDGILRRFDRNKDGELSDDELKAGRARAGQRRGRGR